MADDQKAPENLTRTEFYTALANALFIVLAAFSAATPEHGDWISQTYRVLIMVIIFGAAVHYARRAKMGIFGKLTRSAWTLTLLWFLLAGLWVTVMLIR